MSTLQIANLGAEAGATPDAALPAVETLAHLWRTLFEPPRPYDWLGEEDEAVAWFNDRAAEDTAVAAERKLAGAPGNVVRRVHDKAFALEVARRELLEPRVLRDLACAFDPDDLADADGIREALASWPAWARKRFTLKPRFGTSARGRVAGTGGVVDRAIEGAFPRLAEAGGAVLEPWMERLSDASAQLRVGEDGGVTLLGTLEIVATPAGVLLGHRGEIDSRGRPRSGLPEEEPLREAGALLANAAAAEGYCGPCGIDAFAFRDPVSGVRAFRPAVEFNARFTAGTVAVGILMRVLPALKREMGLASGVLLYFHLALDAPAQGWPDPRPDEDWLLPLAAKGDVPLAPALYVSRDRQAIDELVSASA